jgi:hypothetical protein
MTNDRALAVFTAVYDSVDDARADLDAIGQLRTDDFMGTFDAAIVDQEKGRPHVVQRVDRPVVRVIPEELGFGALTRKELKEAAQELGDNQAGLIVVGQPTLEKGFDKAVTRAKKVLKHTVNATTEELAAEMKEAVSS